MSLDQSEHISAPRVVWGILNRRERRSLLGILVLMLLGTVFETFSLGLVVPAVGLLTQPDYLQRFPAVDDFLGNPSGSQFVIGAMVFLVVVYVAKTIFLIWSLWVQRGYSNAVTTRIGRQLFEIYLRQPYSFHLHRNSSMLIRNSQNSSALMFGIIDPLLNILADSLVTLGLFVLLLILEPRGTIVTIIVFGLSAALFRRFTNQRIRRWGEAQNFHKGMILQHLQQGFGGVKDVKVLGRENHFVTEYAEHLTGNAVVLRRFSVAQALPRSGLEILTIVGLAVLVTTMVASGEDLTAILPVLGLFAAAAFRLLPAVNRVVNNLQIINVSRPMVDDLHHDLALPFEKSAIRSTHQNFNDVIEVRRVSFQYQSAPSAALSNVSLQVNRGEAVGLVGSSGSGKSTLVDVVLGLLTPQSGQVLVDKADIQLNLRGWQDQIGYVPQSIFLTDDTLRRNVAFGLPKDEIDDNAVRAAIRSAQLEDFVSTLPAGLDTVVGERGVRLSGGQRQRIGIARALYHNPAVLVLDEATSSLDTDTEHGVMQAVRALQGDKTVIIVAHRLSTVEYCDRLYRLEDARIVDEGPFHDVTGRSKE
ncbi:MAG: ABC transporter ATP-binding protein [Actinomycetota bacterium]